MLKGKNIYTCPLCQGPVSEAVKLPPGKDIPLEQEGIMALKEGNGLLEGLFGEMEPGPFVNGELAGLFQKSYGSQGQGDIG